jgi:hypothetical protein
MARLGEAIVNGGALDGKRVLSRASVKTMLNDYQVPAGSSPERDEIKRDPEDIRSISRM